MGNSIAFDEEIYQLARLALVGSTEDARLYIARLVRQFREQHPSLSTQLESQLEQASTRSGTLRKASTYTSDTAVDSETRLPLLRSDDEFDCKTAPLHTKDLRRTLDLLVRERQSVQKLHRAGLTPTRSAIFVGEPGLGKTLSARWLADQLGLPLLVLDLSSVMSSLLGRTGANLKQALDSAKAQECVLFIDEIDAIAKRRGDDADVGELKRLVTVLLQEIDQWPETHLLLAATNHPELLDPALWRRFDLVVKFQLPDQTASREAVIRFLGKDLGKFSNWVDLFTQLLSQESFSEIERAIHQLRRATAMQVGTRDELICEFTRSRVQKLDQAQRLECALLLSCSTHFSQRRISEITDISRPTIRKFIAERTSSEMES